MAKAKHVIAVISGKGGVGKSMLAVNIASLLSMNGTSTVLLDADFYNPCVFFHLGLSPHPSGLQELLEGKARIPDSLSIHPGTGLRCISASLQIYKTVQTKNLHKLIDMLDYDFIIIDCAPGFSDIVEDAMLASNEVFLLMTPDIPSATAAMKLISVLGEEHQIQKIHFILNRVSNQSYELHPREIEDICKGVSSVPCRLSAIIPEDSNVPKSIAIKSPIVISSPGSPAARVLRRLAQGLGPRCKGPVSTPFQDPSFSSSPSVKPNGYGAGGNGFFTRLFGWLRGLFR